MLDRRLGFGEGGLQLHDRRDGARDGGFQTRQRGERAADIGAEPDLYVVGQMSPRKKGNHNEAVRR